MSESQIYTLFCLLLGEDSAFPIEIAKNKTVGHLKKLIKPDLDHIAASKLKLYQIDVTGSKQSKDERLKTIVADLDNLEELEATSELSELYSSPPPKKTVHILIKLPLLGRKRPGSSMPESENRPTKILRIAVVPVVPSSASPEEVNTKLVRKDKFHYGRPLRPESTPLALLDEVFGQFAEDIQTYTPTEADNQLASDLQKAMVELHNDEKIRAAEFRKIWETHMPSISLEAAKIGNSDYITDGHFRVGRFCVFITEGKNELSGTHKSDLLLQAGMYYLEIFKEFVPDMQDRFPCLIAYYAGSYIGFAGAIYQSLPLIEVLTPFYPLHASPHETESFSRVARAIAASRRAIDTLKIHYQALGTEIDQATSLLGSTDLEFPYRTYYIDRNGNKIDFCYAQRIWPTKLVFLAQTEQNKVLCVKFTRKYSTEAHQHCLDSGVAPPLHAVEKLLGGWLMVVMDFLDEELYERLDQVKTSRTHIRPRVERAVQILHDGGFVHGDLRDVNLIVRKEKVSDEDLGVMILDFDWAGKQGEAHYPANVNTKHITRPAGVKDGVLVEVAHDKAMVDSLF